VLSVKCSVVYVSPLLFYVWPPLVVHLHARTPTTRTRAAAHTCSRRCAHRTIEINSCLWPTHKAGTACREKIGNLCAVPCFTFHHRIRRVYFSIHTLWNRGDRTALCPLEARLLRATMRNCDAKMRNCVFTSELFVIKFVRIQLTKIIRYINDRLNNQCVKIHCARKIFF